jgi:hypothetical protein
MLFPSGFAAKGQSLLAKSGTCGASRNSAIQEFNQAFVGRQSVEKA